MHGRRRFSGLCHHSDGVESTTLTTRVVSESCLRDTASWSMLMAVACVVAGLWSCWPTLAGKPKQQANISPNPVVRGDKARLCNLAADNEKTKTYFSDNRRIGAASGVTLLAVTDKVSYSSRLLRSSTSPGLSHFLRLTSFMAPVYYLF